MRYARFARRTVNIIDNLSGCEAVCLLGSAASALWPHIKRVPYVRAFSINGYKCDSFA
jgi:hypothetical protein